MLVKLQEKNIIQLKFKFKEMGRYRLPTLFYFTRGGK